MFKPLKYIIYITLGIVVLSIGITAYLIFTFDLNKYKGQIAAQAEKATGRTLTLDGPISLTGFLSPTVVLEDVKLQNATWSKQPYMLEAKRLEANLELLPLINGDVEVGNVALVAPRVLLEVSKTGKKNWEFTPPKDVSNGTDVGAIEQPPMREPKEDAAETVPVGVDGEQEITNLFVHQLSIENGSLMFVDRSTNDVYDLKGVNIALKADALADPMSADIQLRLNDVPVSLKGQIPALSQILNEQAAALDIALDIANLKSTIKGTLNSLEELDAKQLDITVKTDDIAVMMQTLIKAGLPMPFEALDVGSFAMKGTLKGDLMAPEVRGLDVAVGREGAVHVSAKGDIPDISLQGLKLSFDASGQFGALFDLIEKVTGEKITGPRNWPFRVAGTLQNTDTEMRVADLSIMADETLVSGVASFTPALTPRITADLQTDKLDVIALQNAFMTAANDNGVPAAAPAKAQKTARTGKVFSAAPIDASVLKSANVDLKLNAGQLIVPPGIVLDRTMAHVLLQDGALTIKDTTANVAAGEINVDASVKAISQGRIDVSGHLNAKKVELGYLLQRLDATDLVRGAPTRADIAFAARGRSVAELMAGLNSKVFIKVDRGEIKTGLIDRIGADILQALSNTVVGSSDYTILKCAVVNVVAKNGMLDGRNGVAYETGVINALGSAEVNLKTETLDAAIRPQASGGLGVGSGSVANLVRIGGTLANPEPIVDAAGLAKTGLSIAGAIASGGLSVLGEAVLDKATADYNPCETALQAR